MEIETVDGRTVTVMVGEDGGILVIETGKNTLIIAVSRSRGYRILYKTRTTLTDTILLMKHDITVTGEEYEKLTDKIKELYNNIKEHRINIAGRLATSIEMNVRKLIEKHAREKPYVEKIPLHY